MTFQVQERPVDIPYDAARRPRFHAPPFAVRG